MKYFILLSAGAYIFKSIGAYLTKYENNTLLYSSLLALGLLIISIIFINSGVEIFIVYMISAILRGYIEVLFGTKIIKDSPENLKGSIKSISSFFCNFTTIISIFVIIYIMPTWGASSIIILYGLIFALTFVPFWLYSRKAEVLKVKHI